MINELLNDTNEKLREEPDNLELIKLRAVIYASMDLYDKSLQDLEIVINKLPLDRQAYVLRSGCHLKKDEHDLAKEDYLRAIKIELIESDEKYRNEKYPEQVISQIDVKAPADLEIIQKYFGFEKAKVLSDAITNITQKNN